MRAPAAASQTMRALSATRGRRWHIHLVPEGQNVALCGFLPYADYPWRKPESGQRACVACAPLLHVRAALLYWDRRARNIRRAAVGWNHRKLQELDVARAAVLNLLTRAQGPDRKKSENYCGN
jgi:hypothetical protein